MNNGYSVNYARVNARIVHDALARDVGHRHHRMLVRSNYVRLTGVY